MTGRTRLSCFSSTMSADSEPSAQPQPQRHPRPLANLLASRNPSIPIPPSLQAKMRAVRCLLSASLTFPLIALLYSMLPRLSFQPPLASTNQPSLFSVPPSTPVLLLILLLLAITFAFALNPNPNPLPMSFLWNLVCHLHFSVHLPSLLFNPLPG